MKSTINLIPMGNNPYLDVTLNYVIKTADGRQTNIKESKTILITEQKNLEEVFNTDTLEPGDYILELELVYETEPGKQAIATASSHFSVKAEGEIAEIKGVTGLMATLGNYKIVVGILFVGIILLIFMIVLVMTKTKRKKKR